MKTFYCAECGLHLSTIRKAIPKMGMIVDIVEPHVCGEKLVPFSAPSSDIPKFVKDPSEYKFVKSLNELAPPIPERRAPVAERESNKDFPPSLGKPLHGAPGMTSTGELRDRRFDTEDVVKSTAPAGILDQIRQMTNSEPSNSIPSESEEPPSE